LPPLGGTAFSIFSTNQIVLKALTLEQSIKNKVAAFKVYCPLGRSHDLKKGLTNLISCPLLNRILILIIRVIARFTDAELWWPMAFIKSFRKLYALHSQTFLPGISKILHMVSDQRRAG